MAGIEEVILSDKNKNRNRLREIW